MDVISSTLVVRTQRNTLRYDTVEVENRLKAPVQEVGKVRFENENTLHKVKGQLNILILLTSTNSVLFKKLLP